MSEANDLSKVQAQYLAQARIPEKQKLFDLIHEEKLAIRGWSKSQSDANVNTVGIQGAGYNLDPLSYPTVAEWKAALQASICKARELKSEVIDLLHSSSHSGTEVYTTNDGARTLPKVGRVGPSSKIVAGARVDLSKMTDSEAADALEKSILGFASGSDSEEEKEAK